MRERHFMADAARLVTAEELEKFPDDDYRYELVAGRVVRMSPVGFPHGSIVVRFASLLDSHVRARRLPLFVLTEVGFKLAADPDTVRAPDVAVIRRDRLPAALPKGFVQTAPDLAVEVLSPDDRPHEVEQKIREYTGRGATLVVVVDPDAASATVWRGTSDSTELRGDEVLDLDAVVPGFRCSVRELFE